MGSKYLNPKDQPKEVWLFDNGFMIPNPRELWKRSLDETSIQEQANNIIDALVEGSKKIHPEEGGDTAFFNHYVIVDMVNNGKFRAAAVYTNRDEVLNLYNDIMPYMRGDDRQRLWFIVDKETALAEVRPM